MKHEALASSVTAIDDDLLQDAITVPPVPRRPAFGRWGAIAAALLLVFGISVLWQQSGTLRHTYVYTDLSCKNSGKLCYFDRMPQCILSIA